VVHNSNMFDSCIVITPKKEIGKMTDEAKKKKPVEHKENCVIIYITFYCIGIFFKFFLENVVICFLDLLSQGE
jgi:hypothetical protein